VPICSLFDFVATAILFCSTVLLGELPPSWVFTFFGAGGEFRYVAFCPFCLGTFCRLFTYISSATMMLRYSVVLRCSVSALPVPLLRWCRSALFIHLMMMGDTVHSYVVQYTCSDALFYRWAYSDDLMMPVTGGWGGYCSLLRRNFIWELRRERREREEREREKELNCEEREET